MRAISFPTGEPKHGDWHGSGNAVPGLDDMRDELPDQEPNEETTLKCMRKRGEKQFLACIEVPAEEFSFPGLAECLRSERFLRTERENLRRQG